MDLLCKRLKYSNELLKSIVEIERLYMLDRAMCLKSTEEDISKCLKSECSFALYNSRKLIAFSLCYYSDYCTGYIEKCFVLPEYRGNGYQVRLIIENTKALKNKGIEHMYSMVSAENKASVKSFKKVGFCFLKSIEYDGVQRNLMFLKSESRV